MPVEELNTLIVNMFGGFSMRYNGKELSLGNLRGLQIEQFLQLLLQCARTFFQLLDLGGLIRRGSFQFLDLRGLIRHGKIRQSRKGSLRRCHPEYESGHGY